LRVAGVPLRGCSRECCSTTVGYNNVQERKRVLLPILN
jgi:hypothetical protein